MIYLYHLIFSFSYKQESFCKFLQLVFMLLDCLVRILLLRRSSFRSATFGRCTFNTSKRSHLQKSSQVIILCEVDAQTTSFSKQKWKAPSSSYFGLVGSLFDILRGVHNGFQLYIFHRHRGQIT